MKRFLSFTLSVVIVAVAVSYKTEILKAVDSVFGSDTVIDWSEVSSQESELGSRYKNHFSKLSEKQKKAYNRILNEIFNAELEFPQSIPIPVLTSDELSEVVEALKYDNPTLMCIGRDSTVASSDELCFFQPGYTMTPSEQRVKIKTLDSVCERIISAIPQNYGDFEKELFIHDYIVNNCTYDTEVSETSSTPFSCLVDGLSACEGYSKATKLLCEKMGIECYTVSGDAVNADGRTEGHMWNIVNIDGEYYHLDVTWDDPVTQNKEETISHIFFNLNNEEISVDHFNYFNFFECTGTRSNYFIKTNRTFSTLNKTEVSQIKKLLAQSKDGHIEIRFNNSQNYKKAVDSLLTEGQIYKIAASANQIYGLNLNTKSVGYIETPSRNVIDLYF